MSSSYTHENRWFHGNQYVFWYLWNCKQGTIPAFCTICTLNAWPVHEVKAVDECFITLLDIIHWKYIKYLHLFIITSLLWLPVFSNYTYWLWDCHLVFKGRFGLFFKELFELVYQWYFVCTRWYIYLSTVWFWSGSGYSEMH